MYRRRSPALLRALERLVEGKWAGWLINLLLIPALLLAALWLPPVSIAERVFEADFTTIGPEGGAVMDPDGTQITLLPEGLTGEVKVRLNPIPRITFLEGKAGEALMQAATQIPTHLIVRSPYYQLESKGGQPGKVVATIPIPNDSEPYSTLDLYGWDGQRWVWLPSHVIVEDDVIEAQLDFLPSSLVVMQTMPVAPQVAASLPAGADMPEPAQGVLAELNPAGLYLGDDQGAIAGSVAPLPPEAEAASFAVVPTIANWGPDGVVRSDLADNLLVDPEVRNRHADALADLVVRNLYSGINVNYQGVNPDLRREFTAFVTRLAQRLHENSKILSVTVDRPVQVAADRWETGAYDWRALGSVADLLKVPAPVDPRAYESDGQVQALLTWAVGEVNRYKLQLTFSTRSLEQTGNVLVPVPLMAALEPLAEIVGPADKPIISPGEEIALSLKGVAESAGVQSDPASGLHWYTYTGDDGQEHTVWIASASSLARRLQLAASFNLRGVALRHVLQDEQEGQVWEALRAYGNAGQPQAQTEFTVHWEVRDAAGNPLDQHTASLSDPNYKVVAPEPGEYTILAMLSTDGGRTYAEQSVAGLLVASPTPTPTPVPPTPTPTPIPPTPTPRPPTPTPKPQPQPEPTQAAQAPPPAAPAPPNPGFGYGVQAHMIDNDQAPKVMAAINDLGFGWVKQQVEWFRHEPNKGQYVWGPIDYLVDQANAAGVKVLLSVVKAPKWARPPNTDFSVEGPPANPQDYADFIGAMAARYKGRVQAYEIWNEQNMDYEWGREPFDANRYVQILAAAYSAIKAQDPNAIVVSGALTPTGAPPPWAVDDMIYLEQMYQAGLKDHCDAIGAHPSGYNVPPDADWQTWSDPTAIFRGPSDNKHHSWSFKATMEGYRNIMVKYGDGNKTIWPTEFGWASNPTPVQNYEYAADNTLEEQAQFTVQAYQMGKQWGWVGVMFLWNLNFKVIAPGTEMAQWGIVDPYWSPMPVYNALKAMPK